MMGEGGKHKWIEFDLTGGLCRCDKCDSMAYSPFTYEPKICPQIKGIYLEPWDMAGFMRDHCNVAIWELFLYRICRTGNQSKALRATPWQWHEAAIKAWDLEKEYREEL